MAIPSEGPFVVLHPPVITDQDGPFLCLLAQMRTDIRTLIVISARPCPKKKGGDTGSYRPAQLSIFPPISSAPVSCDGPASIGPSAPRARSAFTSRQTRCVRWKTTTCGSSWPGDCACRRRLNHLDAASDVPAPQLLHGLNARVACRGQQVGCPPESLSPEFTPIDTKESLHPAQEDCSISRLAERSRSVSRSSHGVGLSAFAPVRESATCCEERNVYC